MKMVRFWGRLVMDNFYRFYNLVDRANLIRKPLILTK